MINAPPPSKPKEHTQGANDWVKVNEFSSPVIVNLYADYFIIAIMCVCAMLWQWIFITDISFVSI